VLQVSAGSVVQADELQQLLKQQQQSGPVEFKAATKT
jgi:hypothetical protein